MHESRTLLHSFGLLFTLGLGFAFPAPEAFADTPPAPAKNYRVSQNTCTVYEMKNKAWVKADPLQLPIGTQITGRPSPGRKDLIYTSWQNKSFAIYTQCLTEVASPAAAAPSAQDDEAVDLGNPNSIGNALDAPPPTGAQPSGKGFAPPNATGFHHHDSAQGVAPNFKVFFDFDLVSTGTKNLSFDNYHSFLFFELLPTPDISFSFDVNPAPRYYELDYQVTPKLQMRIGKIWIPFDDLSPHNIFGGRINVSRLAQGPAFLPDLWTEMGVGMKYQIADTKGLQLDGHLYIVNGFGSGGVDPISGGSNYPNFQDTSIGGSDNNADKAIGGRLHALIANRLGLGFSFYHDRWTDEAVKAASINMYGLDTQYSFGNAFQARAGVIIMKVGLPDSTNFFRGGYYVELGKRFGKDQMWKFLVREGQVENDDRIVSVTDERLVGATLLVQPNMLQYSVEYSYDIERNSLKTQYGYFAGRVVMAF